MVGHVFRTGELAKLGGISVQQVRNYEANGFIPPAERGSNGYRLYREKHVMALQTIRALIKGYQWQRAGAIMQAIHQGDPEKAVALIDEFHAQLAHKRVQLEQTLTILRTLATTPISPSTRRSQHLRIGEAAQQVGVRVSAVHFWEQEGLLHPTRDPHNRYRLYDEAQLRRLRVITVLREAGYPFDAVRLALDELAAGQPGKAIAGVEHRGLDIARTSLECITALTHFHAYVSTYWAESWEAIRRKPYRHTGWAVTPP
jgi:DNA-binding transcriptional MerR regulator